MAARVAGPSLTRPLFTLLSLWTIATFLLYLASRNIGQQLKWPRNIEDVRLIVETLQSVSDSRDYYSILLLYVLAYLYKQTFAIPGSVFLNVLGGAVFGPMVAVPLTCVLTATGASSCYMLSYLIGGDIINYYLRHRIEPFRKLVSGSHGSSELMMLLSLRLFPVSPNWLLNIASPHVGVKLYKFALSVLLGLTPYNFLCVQTGVILSEITNINGFMDARTFTMLTSASLLLAGFVYFRQKTK